jgi:hypothetical protein
MANVFVLWSLIEYFRKRSFFDCISVETPARSCLDYTWNIHAGEVASLLVSFVASP